MTSHNTPMIKLLKHSQRVIQKVTAWIEAIQSGIFMGLIDDEAFQAFDTYPFDETRLIDVTAEAQLGLEPWERHVAHEHLPHKASLLVVAAGGARELVGLSDLGYDATGVEYGRDLCDASQRELAIRQSNATITWSERLTIPPCDPPYEAAFIARKFLSHVHDRHERINFLQNIRQVMTDDATLVIGFYTRDRDSLAFRVQAMIANVLRRLRGQRDNPVEVGDHLDPDSPLYHHHYIWEEVRDELREAGFATVEHANTWFGWAVAKPIAVEANSFESTTNNNITEEQHELATTQ